MAKEKYSYGYAQDKYKPFKQKENEYNLKLKTGSYYVLRFDGKDMTASFKIDHKAINGQFFKTMESTFTDFCKAIPQVLFAYSFSDEISILIRGSKDRESEDNRIEKLLSLYSGKLALLFYKNAQNNSLNLQNKDWIFDARIMHLNRQEVIDYFLARQAYAIDKYIMQLKAENHIDYTLHTSDTVLPQLESKGIFYDKLPVKFRFGLVYSKYIKQNSFEFDSDNSLLNRMCFGKNKRNEEEVCVVIL